MYGSRISQFHIAHFFHTVFGNTVAGKFDRHDHFVLCIAPHFANVADVTVGCLRIVFCLHHLVAHTEVVAADLQIGKLVPRRIDKLSDMVEIYMDDCKARIRPTTYKGKEDIIAVHIMPYFKNLKVNEIQPMNVRRWQTELMNNQKNYKPTYLRTLNSQLSAIFNFAVKYYGLGSNPVQKSGTIGKKNSGLEQIWTADEFKIFIDAVSDKLQSKVIFNLLYWTGMRSGEMLALTLNDFDFEERTVSITKNYARIDGEDLFLDPKTPKSNRKITLPQFVCDLVKDYADRLYGYDPSDRLFEVTKHYLKHEMERGCKKTGLREIRVHDLRHSHASLLIELGFAPLLISERLGHESVTTTLEIYSHLYPTKHGEVADRLEAFA